MSLKLLSIPLLALVLAACGPSKDGKGTIPDGSPENPALGPYPVERDTLLQTPLVFGSAWVQYHEGSTWQYALPVENRGPKTLCPPSMKIEARGDNGQIVNLYPGIEGQLMRDGADHGSCLAAGGKGYVLGFIIGEIGELQSLKVVSVYEGYMKDPQPLVQVSIVDQSFNKDYVAFRLRNDTSETLKAESYSKWILRSGDKILDWGFVYSSEKDTVAPGETFLFNDYRPRSQLPSDTVQELLPGFFETASN